VYARVHGGACGAFDTHPVQYSLLNHYFPQFMTLYVLLKIYECTEKWAQVELNVGNNMFHNIFPLFIIITANDWMRPLKFLNGWMRPEYYNPTISYKF
jgi:hypothetical protein